MLNTLAIAFRDKQVFTDDTIVEAWHRAKTLGGVQTTRMKGRFLLNKIIVDGVAVLFELSRPNESIIYRVPCEDVETIDGMPPERLAGIFNIKPDGTTKKQKLDPLTGLPVRRGRKPNKIKELMNELSKQRNTTA